MVVLRPILPSFFACAEDREAVASCFTGEFMRTCKCGLIGIASPVLARSSFYRNRAEESGFCWRCRHCSTQRNKKLEAAGGAELRARKRARYAKRVASETLEEKGRRREAWREAKRRSMERDPEGFRERRRASEKRYRTKNRESVRETARMGYRLRRERAGYKILVPESTNNNRWRTGIIWPARPYHDWLEKLFDGVRHELHTGKADHVRYYAEVAERLGLSSRRLYDHLHSDVVDQGIVERGCIRHGIHPGDIYPHAYGRGPTVWGSGTLHDPYQVLPEGWKS